MRTVRTGALVAAVIVQGCSSATPRDTTSAALLPSSSPVGGDVTTYRGTAARTGTMPGPGPGENPAIAWVFEAGAPIASSPLLIGDVVVFVDRDGVVYQVDLDTGLQRWSVALGARAAGTPVAEARRIVIGDDAGHLTALDLETGSSIWVATLDGPITGSAAWVGDLVVAATTNGTAYGINAATGEMHWWTSIGAGIAKSIASTETTAYLGATGGELVALRLADGAVVLRSTVAAVGDIGTPAVAGGLVYLATGIDARKPSARTMIAVNSTTGRVAWRFASPSQAQVYTAAIADDRAYVVGEDGRVAALDAATGMLQWSTTIAAPVEALPAVADGVVYVVANGGPAAAIDALTGSIHWSVPLQGVPYAPTVARGYLLVGTSFGTLYAIGGPAS